MNTNYPMDYILIHKALHDRDAHEVTVEGMVYPIKVHKTNGYRFVEGVQMKGKTFYVAQQNLKKASIYASRARKGERISWVIEKEGPWIRIDRNVETMFPEVFP